MPIILCALYRIMIKITLRTVYIIVENYFAYYINYDKDN